MADRRSTSASKLLSRFSRCTSGLAMAFGVMVLTGWVLQVQRLKGLIPGQVTVKANTAVCFMLIGLALWLALAGPKKPLANALSRSLALAASMVGLLSFLEFLYGWDFGIDQLLFTAGPDDLPGSVRPGLMSAISAGDFFLLGISIALLDTGKRWSYWVQSLFATIAAVASVFGILDFVLDPEGTHTYIAPPTALVLFLFSLAVLCARTERGLGALLVGVTPGGELSRRLLPAAVLLPVAIGGLWWKGQHTGLFSEWTGIVILMVSSGVLFAGLTLWTAFALDRVELARKHAEESVRRLAAIVTSSNDAIIGKTLEGIVTSWNPGAEAIYGYSAEEMMGQSMKRVVPADRLDEFEGFLQALRRGETVRHYETERTRKDGKRIVVAVSISPLKDEMGRIVGASTIARDISERKQAEEEWKRTFDTVSESVMLLDLEQRVRRCNRATAQLLAMDPAAIVGKHCYMLVHGQTSPPANCPVQRMLQTQTEHRADVEEPRLRKTFDVIATPLRGAGDKLIGCIHTVRDITERKQAEEALRRASLQARSLIEASLDPLVTISREGKITDVNQATEKATGRSRQQLVGSDFSTYFTEPEKAREGYQHVFVKGFIRDHELAIRNVSGAVMDVLYNATVFRGANGEVEGVFAAARDITERKRTEAALRDSERQLSVRNRIAQICLSLEDDGMYAEVLKVVLQVTQSKYGVFGYIDEQGALVVPTMTRTIWDQCQVPEKDIVFPREQWGDSIWPTAIRQKRTLYSNQASTRTPQGHVLITRNISLPVLHRGEVIGLLQVANKDSDYTAEDIAVMGTIADYLAPVLNARLQRDRQEKSRRQAEEEVRKLNNDLERRVVQRTAQLEAANKELEAFSYSVSHDLRAPLRHISGFSKILSEEFATDLPSEAQHLLQRIQEGTQRMGQLVDDLLNLGRVGRTEISLQVAGLRSIVDDVIESLKSDVGGRQVEWKIGDLPYVECDTTLMQQVFQNLLSNALKFTRPRTHAVIEIGQEQRNGSSVVYVRDNGVGFSMKYADKLFGVFQRLHRSEDFEGTGVGLATVQRIVQKHGGRIWAEAELDKGAKFCFTLGGSQSSEANSKAWAAGEKS